MTPENITLPEYKPTKALPFTYPCYKDMFDNKIMFAFKGIVTSDLVTRVLEIMETRLEEERGNKKISKKVYNVMVECLTNVYADEAKATKKEYDPTAILLVRKVDKSYHVTTGNYISNNRVQELKRILDKINAMSKENLRSYYQEVLVKEESGTQGLTTLGIVDLARKSRQNLAYQFKYVNEDFTFFSIEAKISANSI